MRMVHSVQPIIGQMRVIFCKCYRNAYPGSEQDGKPWLKALYIDPWQSRHHGIRGKTKWYD